MSTPISIDNPEYQLPKRFPNLRALHEYLEDTLLDQKLGELMTKNKSHEIASRDDVFLMFAEKVWK